MPMYKCNSNFYVFLHSLINSCLLSSPKNTNGTELLSSKAFEKLVVKSGMYTYIYVKFISIYLFYIHICHNIYIYNTIYLCFLKEYEENSVVGRSIIFLFKR